MTASKEALDNFASPDGIDFPMWELQNAHSGGVLDFSRLLRVSSGFALLVLQYNDASYRDKVIPYLDRHAKAPAVFALAEQDEVAVFEDKLATLAVDHDVVHVIGLHEWLAGEHRSARLRGLNYHREVIAEQVRTVVALWMLEDDIRDLALEAPDLWAWRKGVVDFSRTREERHDLERTRLDLENADFDERGKRMEALKRYLSEHPDETITRAGLLRELGQILDQFGQPDEALQAFQEAQAIYLGNDFKRDHTFVLGEIARIYFGKGDVEKALKLHEEELEVYESLGDKRSWAVTLGDIARIYSDKGDVEKALTLHEERLQVFESLGDIRERAVTLGEIARIYIDRGDVEKGLKLHEEMLQVFERLGDKRSRAVTLGEISRTYVAKGDVEKALKLLEEMLQVFESLGDLSCIAATHWDLAQINLKRKEFQEAAEHLVTSYNINLNLGRLDGICYVGRDFGQLLCNDGQVEQGIRILERSEKGFRQLGRKDLADQTKQVINDVKHQTGKRKRKKKA